MNSPLVIEQAKKLVVLAGFNKCLDDEARIQFLYQRAYQRPARPEEVKLGLEFLTDKPEPEKVASLDATLQTISNDDSVRKNARKKQFGKKRMDMQQGGGKFRQRDPLTMWEEYAHALLQGNKTSFVD